VFDGAVGADDELLAVRHVQHRRVVAHPPRPRPPPRQELADQVELAARAEWSRISQQGYRERRKTLS
jgi:hypothetical protein